MVIPNVFFGITLVIGILNRFVPFALCSVLGIAICQFAFWRTFFSVSNDLIQIIKEANVGDVATRIENNKDERTKHNNSNFFYKSF